MPYVTSNGTVTHSRPRNPIVVTLSSVKESFDRLSLVQKAVIGLCVFFAYRRFFDDNPLQGGKIPAADLKPDQHWDRIAGDDTFVRGMVKHIGQKHKTSGQAKVLNHYAKQGELKIAMGLVDFGGPDGHVFERVDLRDMEAYRGTRCASTQTALTAYFCGASVAENLDVGLEEKRKLTFRGIQSFADFIECRHRQGRENQDNHRRSVYRIGVGCEHALAGYSHAFNIIAQPDGTFYWLQSYISHYSLRNWMEKTDGFGQPLGQLTLDQLLNKLHQLEGLMNISEWSSTANQDYLELFGVDKELAARKEGNTPVQMTWKPSHRLSSFHWDEACEYPESRVEADNQMSNESDSPYHFDDCSIAAWSATLTDTHLVKNTADA